MQVRWCGACVQGVEAAAVHPAAVVLPSPVEVAVRWGEGEVAAVTGRGVGVQTVLPPRWGVAASVAGVVAPRRRAWLAEASARDRYPQVRRCSLTGWACGGGVATTLTRPGCGEPDIAHHGCNVPRRVGWCLQRSVLAAQVWTSRGWCHNLECQVDVTVTFDKYIYVRALFVSVSFSCITACSVRWAVWVWRRCCLSVTTCPWHTCPCVLHPPRTFLHSVRWFALAEVRWHGRWI